MNNRDTFVFYRGQDEISIGRDKSCDVPIKGVGVSRKHALVKFVNGRAVIVDNHSACGTCYNNQIIREHELHEGDRLTFGVVVFSVGFSDDKLVFKRIISPKQSLENSSAAPTETGVLSVGRGELNSIKVSHPLISRTHFKLFKQKNGKYLLKDNNSTNGTFVNGKRAASILLNENDIIQAGPFRFLIDNGKLVQVEDYKKIKIEVKDACVVKNGKPIVRGVTLSVNPGEFTAIMGPSGSGKTTLLEAMSGRTPLQSGSIYYNGLFLERFLPAFNSMVGYVGQSNLLRGCLRVRETLAEQALLRLPGDSLQAERESRIEEVLDMLDTERLSGSRIDTLSGGEAKRIHFGVELISSPTVIFFDEPFSGLDPGLIKKFMRLFRSICGKGHSLVLATHRLEQVELCDKIAFINKGKVLAEGKPGELPARFNVRTLPEVYEKVYNMSSKDISEYLYNNRKDETGKVKLSVSEADESEHMISREKCGFLTLRNRKSIYNSGYRRKSVGPLKQFILLMSRYLKVTVRDIRTLLVVFSQVPVISLMLALVYERSGEFLPLSFFFCVTITSVWIGAVNSIREISGEWMLFVKESSIGLSACAYLLAKIIVLALTGIIQSVVFSGLIFMLFRGVEPSVEFLLLVFAAVFSGILLGLFVSSFSSGVSRSVSWLPVLFIPQIFFSGVMVPFDYMPKWGEMLSRLTITRPVFSIFKKTYFLDHSLFGLPEWKTLFFINLILVILIYAGLKYYLFKHHNST